MWVIVPYMDDTFNFHLASVPSRINGRRHPSTLARLTSDKKNGGCKSNKVCFLFLGKDDAN
jgi:hypothetical protein